MSWDPKNTKKIQPGESLYTKSPIQPAGTIMSFAFLKQPFAFPKEGYIPLFWCSTCKDQLIDYISSLFKYKNTKEASWRQYEQIDLSKTRLLIQNFKTDGYAESMLDLLNQLEEIFDYEKTMLYPVEGSQNALVVEADPNWMKAPPLFSLFTLLLRINSNAIHKVGEPFYKALEAKDKSCAGGDHSPYAIPGIKRIIKYGEREIFGTLENIADNYPIEEYTAKTPNKRVTGIVVTPDMSFHSNSGIVAFSQRNLLPIFPKRWDEFPDVEESWEELLSESKSYV